MVSTVTWSHGDKLAQAAAEEHVWVHGPMEVVVCFDVPGPVTARNHKDAQRLGHRP